ncbi:MAG TPA: DUF6411 family protein [Gaiellaceae bacterium]|nr:DUF6411 family protein [Gaiellaceae bacterium]
MGVLAVLGWVAVIGVTVLLCVGLFVLGFAAPGRGWRAERGVHQALFKGENKAGDKAPNAVDGWVRKPFETSRKATGKSAEAGRKSRFRLPF